MTDKIIYFDDFEKQILSDDNLKSGVITDSNIIFAASYELDLFYEDAAFILNILSKHDIPVYTNINVRSEFLELHRRVLIAESLIDLYEDYGSVLNPELQHQLKSHRTSYRKAVQEDRLYKLTDKKVKHFRNELAQHKFNDKDAWSLFCETYFAPRMNGIWEKAVDAMNLHFLTLRNQEKHPNLVEDISWEKMTEIVSLYGIGVSDAMIVNIFLSSNFSALLTTDSDITYVINKINPKDKYVVIPQKIKS